MPSSRFDEVRDYAFADEALRLRTRLGLTQREFGELLHVSVQSIHAWESGLSYPGAERLKQLIAVYLEHGALTPGGEEEEAAALWETVREKAPRRIPSFDQQWFQSLGTPASPAPRPPTPRPPTNLRPVRTSFVGRVDDLATLTQRLDPVTGSRLLTLLGVAGCGKTRLAIAVAEAVQDAYSDGICFVELAPLLPSLSKDPAQVAATTLATLGLQEQSGQDLLETLVWQLRTKQLLLVLDNCEHVAPACAALVERLLETCLDLRILTTTQLALGLPDEDLWQVATLSVPPMVAGFVTPGMMRVIEESDAVKLFVERAQAVRPGFVLDAETAGIVAAICQELDGLPLAIELAAARLHVLPLEDLLKRLDDRYRVLRRGGRSADRHQALETTMHWSYSLLAPAEQALLRRLSVFSEGWDLGAAERVCAGEIIEHDAVLEHLDELHARSLVYVRMDDGVPRYGMLETVREYGLQRLVDAAERDAIRNRHLEWCVALAEEAAPALQGADQGVWLARLSREHNNMRGALQWAIDRELSTDGLRLAAGLWQFWRSRSHLSEGRRWLARVLALPSDNDRQTLEARANALEGAAWLTEDEHEFAQASVLFAQSEALHRALGDEHRMTGLLVNTAMEARARGNYARATALLEQSLAQHQASGNRDSIKRGGLGLSLARLALVLAEQGGHDRARELYQECLELHQELGDREGIGNAMLGLGDIARDLGDSEGVRSYCEETLALFRELGHTWVGFSLNNLALAAYIDGDLELAACRSRESAALFRSLDAGPSLAEVLVTLGRIQGARREADAQTYLEEALSLAAVAGPRFVVAGALDELGLLALRRGDAERAVHILAIAAGMRQAMGAPVRPADRPIIEAALADARGILGESAFSDAWRAGQSLSRTWRVEDFLPPKFGTNGEGGPTVKVVSGSKEHPQGLGGMSP